MESNDSSKISWPSEYFKHISRHSGNIKVGVNQKKKAITIGVVKNGRLSAEAIFAQEKIILLYLKKPRWYRLLLD